ncbi:hypothetical protein GCM10010207_80260 [Streptomyces atratus]|nr:hypothetical protein GCM10010207_80260 [Streptomyces atratus]
MNVSELLRLLQTEHDETRRVRSLCARVATGEFGRVLRRTHDDVRPVPGAGGAARPRRTRPGPAARRRRELGAALTPGGPEHPWTGMQISAGWGSGNKLRYVTVQPNLVAEVRADTAVDRGRHQHSVRYLRIRDDLTPGDIAAAG